jgi:hypothetical protein
MRQLLFTGTSKLKNVSFLVLDELCSDTLFREAE